MKILGATPREKRRSAEWGRKEEKAMARNRSPPKKEKSSLKRRALFYFHDQNRKECSKMLSRM